MNRAAALCLLLVGLCIARPALANDTVYYYYTDAQGSPVAVTDAQGNVIERTQYAPYGQVLNRPEHDGPGYTGHEEDAQTGLTNMKARYDDKAIGRMLSMDPVDVDPATGANFNRYAYANDNPYRYVDPDGRCTGSHISNSDGTCASSGDFTTQASNAHLVGASASQRGAILGIQEPSQNSVGSGNGPMGKTSVPQSITPSGSDYSSMGDAAKAFGDAYSGKSVEEKSEYQTGIIYAGGRYNYILPGAGPPGATIVDPTPLFDAIRGAGFNIVAWAHTHWDGNLMFSGADMQFVYRTHGTLFLTNRNDQTYMLNYRILNNAASGYQGAERILQYIEGAKDIQGQPVQ